MPSSPQGPHNGSYEGDNPFMKALSFYGESVNVAIGTVTEAFSHVSGQENTTCRPYGDAIGSGYVPTENDHLPSCGSSQWGGQSAQDPSPPVPKFYKPVQVPQAQPSSETEARCSNTPPCRAKDAASVQSDSRARTGPWGHKPKSAESALQQTSPFSSSKAAPAPAAAVPDALNSTFANDLLSFDDLPSTSAGRETYSARTPQCVDLLDLSTPSAPPMVGNMSIDLFAGMSLTPTSTAVVGDSSAKPGANAIGFVNSSGAQSNNGLFDGMGLIGSQTGSQRSQQQFIHNERQPDKGLIRADLNSLFVPNVAPCSASQERDLFHGLSVSVK